QLLELSASDEDRALTRLITEETDRIVAMVDRMEVFSDERPIDRYPVNIHLVLDHVKAIARNGFASRIRINESYDPSLPPVYANRDQLVQVFLNLVKNAAEAVGSDPRGEVTLSTAFRPGIRVSVPGTQDRVSLPLEFCVHDNGPGVSEDILPILFDPFITTKQNGSGLGLALVAAGGIRRPRPRPRRFGSPSAGPVRPLQRGEAERGRPRPCAGREERRRARRHRRVRTGRKGDHLPGADAGVEGRSGGFRRR